MKTISLSGFLIVVLLLIGGVFLYARQFTPTQQERQPAPPVFSEAPPAAGVSTSNLPGLMNEIQSSAPFHVYFPANLPQDYTLSASANVMYTHGDVFYTINASSGIPFINVEEGLTSDQGAPGLFSLYSMREGGSVTSTEINGQTGYVGAITSGFQVGHQLTVVSFARDGVEVQLSSFNTVDSTVLVQLADAME